jgi:cell division protein FtsQ
VSELAGRARELLSPEAKVLPFRRPSGGVRVRRRSAWPALAGLVVKAVALVGTPVALGVWLFASPTFALARIEVEGNRHVPSEWVERALEPLGGENLLRLSLPAVEKVVKANPWVAAVTIDKELPRGLRLRVAERVPAALLRTATGLVILDRDGRVIAPLAPGAVDGDLLLVSLGAATEIDPGGALAIAAELERVAPDWAATLSEVQLLSEDDFRLFLGALPFPVAVRLGTLAERLPELRALLPELERRYPGIDFVDLRFERRIVFQPMVSGPMVSHPAAERS